MRIVALLVISGITALADLVECQNGDRYNGKVLLVDEHNVKIQNDITGLLSIPRAKVSSTTFGTGQAVRPTVKTNSPASPKQLQFDQSAIDQVQNQFLGEANPEATQMFQQMVRDLMSGKLDVSDIRGKAQTTLGELKDLQKDLGEDEDAAALLGSYAAILENFLKQAPAATNSVSPK